MKWINKMTYMIMISKKEHTTTSKLIIKTVILWNRLVAAQFVAVIIIGCHHDHE